MAIFRNSGDATYTIPVPSGKVTVAPDETFEVPDDDCDCLSPPEPHDLAAHYEANPHLTRVDSARAVVIDSPARDGLEATEGLA